MEDLGDLTVEQEAVVGVFGTDLGQLVQPNRSGCGKVSPRGLKFLLSLHVTGLSLHSLVQFLTSVRLIPQGEVLSLKSSDLALKLDLPSIGSPQSLLKVLNPLGQLHNLSLLIVQQRGKVKVPGGSFTILVRKLKVSSKEAVEFMLDQQESSVEFVSVLTLDRQS